MRSKPIVFVAVEDDGCFWGNSQSTCQCLDFIPSHLITIDAFFYINPPVNLCRPGYVPFIIIVWVDANFDKTIIWVI